MAPLSVVCSLAAPGFPSAGKLIDGDNSRIYYADNGAWNDAAFGYGFRIKYSGVWRDVTYPGAPHAGFSMEWTDSATRQYYTENTSYGSNMTVTSSTDLSTTAVASSEWNYTAGTLTVVKTETWDNAAKAMRVAFTVKNGGTVAASSFRLFFTIDPDQESGWSSGSSTVNDTVDTDSDGSNDYTRRSGPTTGLTIGFGVCGAVSPWTVGHYSSWPSIDADMALSDSAASSGDIGMAIRYTHPTSVAVGESIGFSFLVVVGDTAAAAQSTYTASLGLCGGDADGDGLSDTVEGSSLDTDGDGVKNYLDTDSDADGILDAVELTTDTDGDGTVNYLDTDSDADGILDQTEGKTDTDGDKAANCVDTDADGDTLLDRTEGVADTDGDKLANYVDTDSDGDTLFDRTEGTPDTDGDGNANYLDTDADAD